MAVQCGPIQLLAMPIAINVRHQATQLNPYGRRWMATKQSHLDINARSCAFNYIDLVVVHLLFCHHNYLARMGITNKGANANRFRKADDIFV